MAGINIIRNIAFLSTYHPRECGLAIAGIIDMEKYEHRRVTFKLSQHERESYFGTAQGAVPYARIRWQ